ncbi:MAG: CarD family transcriptional regulator [Anaerolineae bacterium]|jgi:RNA polymerase-interacting CarD/CdnL/TRCF family regulator|nr:CarD family transcriptional regulator [Anaerolineae bacterium]
MADFMFQKGDWIVHTAYGVGQISKVEKKPIHGEMVNVFRVKTKDSVYWLPVANAGNDRIRRIADRQNLDKALTQLNSPPKEIGSDYRTRNNHIAEVFSQGSIQSKVELLRDLMGLRQEKVWSNTENDAANTIFEQLSSEYSVICEVSLEEARDQINQLVTKNFDGFSLV